MGLNNVDILIKICKNCSTNLNQTWQGWSLGIGDSDLRIGTNKIDHPWGSISKSWELS
jgi:hypothetical protein